MDARWWGKKGGTRPGKSMQAGETSSNMENERGGVKWPKKAQNVTGKSLPDR